MKIVIGADIVPTKSNADLFAAGNMKTLFGTLVLSFWIIWEAIFPNSGSTEWV